MLRSILRKLSRSMTSNSSRPARPMSGRTTLAIEGLEDRLALSTASQLGSTLLIEANLGYTVNTSTTVGVQSDVRDSTCAKINAVIGLECRRDFV